MWPSLCDKTLPQIQAEALITASLVIPITARCLLGLEFTTVKMTSPPPSVGKYWRHLAWLSRLSVCWSLFEWNVVISFKKEYVTTSSHKGFAFSWQLVGRTLNTRQCYFTSAACVNNHTHDAVVTMNGYWMRNCLTASCTPFPRHCVRFCVTPQNTQM